MTRHTSHRFNLMYQAILATSLSATALSAHAVNLSQANINSAQHEPLSATINVSDINADNFSASIGNASLYQQMGLSKDASIQVQFIPTSDTTGQLVLSSNAPISSPFTDVVLNLNNNGEQIVEPQTLLMPLPSSAQIATNNSRATIVNNTPQDLPVVSDTVVDDIAITNSTPLAVQNIAPPPLFSDTDEVASTAPTQTTETASLASGTAPLATSEHAEVLAQATPEGTNTQLEILTQQVTRRFYPAGTAPASTPTADTEEMLTATTPADTEEDTLTAKTPDTTEIKPATTPSGEAVYVVQNGDNLWSIANEIAKANDMSLTEVMDALHKQNPDAFNNGKANQLKANATLNIPNYEAIPSQKAIQEAISARQKARQNARESGKATTASAQKPTQRRATNARTQPAKPRTTTRPLPTAQMTLVTPTQRGQATGTQQTRPATASQNNKASGNGTQLASTLQNTRQNTASNARRVNSLNQELSSATERLQLQNQKLAELEARLKALRDK